MTIIEWLIPAMKKLYNSKADSPRRDCLVLIEDLLAKDRSWVTAHGEFELSKEQIIKLDAQVKQRVSHEPLAYIRGKAWFYGRFFEVTTDVMIPRPESESFIEFLKDMNLESIADIGTGSGCLAITAKLEYPNAQITAIDIDEKALKVAKRNAKTYKVNIAFAQGSLLEPLQRMPDVIITNLPYVPEGLISSPEIEKEPKTALFSGEDGMDLYRDFWHQIGHESQKPSYVLTESLEFQHEKMNRLAQESGYELVASDILVQKFKLSI